MKKTWVDETRRKISDYFENISPEKLNADLKKAGIEYYKNVKDSVLGVQEEIVTYTEYGIIRSKVLCVKIETNPVLIENFDILDLSNLGDYNYNLAA